MHDSLHFSDPDFNKKWHELTQKLAGLVGKKPDLNGVLFLIGVQELGSGPKKFSKEQKQDLMHIATCKLLSTFGYYHLTGIDAEGWPHWEQTQTMPTLNLAEQEKLLKYLAISYFKEWIDFED